MLTLFNQLFTYFLFRKKINLNFYIIIINFYSIKNFIIKIVVSYYYSFEIKHILINFYKYYIIDP